MSPGYLITSGLTILDGYICIHHNVTYCLQCLRSLRLYQMKDLGLGSSSLVLFPAGCQECARGRVSERVALHSSHPTVTVTVFDTWCALESSDPMTPKHAVRALPTLLLLSISSTLPTTSWSSTSSTTSGLISWSWPASMGKLPLQLILTCLSC